MTHCIPCMSHIKYFLYSHYCIKKKGNIWFLYHLRFREKRKAENHCINGRMNMQKCRILCREYTKRRNQKCVLQK